MSDNVQQPALDTGQSARVVKARTLQDDEARVGQNPAAWEAARAEAKQSLESEIDELERALKEGTFGRDKGLVNTGSLTPTAPEISSAPEALADAVKKEIEKEANKGDVKEVEEIPAAPPVSEPKPVAPTPPPPKQLTRQEMLHEEIRAKEREKLELVAKHKELELAQAPHINELERFVFEKKRHEEKLRPFLEAEASLDRDIASIRERESQAPTPEDRHTLETSRYPLEDKRKEIESQKWEVEKGMEDITTKVEAAQANLEAARRQVQVVEEKIKGIDRETERLRLEIELVGISEHKEKLEVEWIQFNDERKNLEVELETLKQEERFSEEERDRLESLERTSASSQEQREAERARQETETRLREIEGRRFEIEKRLTTITASIERLKPSYQQALTREEDMQKRLASLTA